MLVLCILCFIVIYLLLFKNKRKLSGYFIHIQNIHKAIYNLLLALKNMHNIKNISDLLAVLGIPI